MTSEHQPIRTQEHKTISKEQLAHLGEWIDKQSLRDPTKAETLGLHKKINGIAPGNFIGAVWIGEGENTTPLIAASKFMKPEMDYMSMYLACAEDPIIRAHLKKCFSFWPEQQLIKAEDLPKLNELLIAAFLRELNDLCTRHLRKHFERETENLRGKVKGKILLHLQVKKNLVHGRRDRVFCSYQTIKNNIPENRVLRAALEQSAKFVNSRPDPEAVLNRWIHSSRAALSGVSVVKVNKSDFRNLRVRGSFLHYRRAIELAKFVLLRLGTDPHAEVSESASTPPFAINSAELFERYAEKILRGKHPGLEAGYEKKDTAGDGGANGFNVKVRPDFWIPKEPDANAKIIDAKYKSKHEISEETKNEDQDKNTSKPSREDIFQMIAYSRHKNLLEKKLNCGKDDTVELVLVYPAFNDGAEKEEKTDNSFFAPLTMRFIKCPVKKSGEPENDENRAN